MFFSSLKHRKRVAIFGGSFNPPHLGHSAICRWLLDSGAVDEVWVIPCYIHPLGKELIPFEHRLAMSRLALVKLGPQVKVLDFERQLRGVSFTIRTIRNLQALNRDVKMSLVTGDDVQDQTEEWQEFDKIRELVEIIRVPRGPASPVPDISSSEIRRRIAARESYVNLVEPEIAVYIVTKGLYR